MKQQSRLTKIEETKNIKQASLFGALTIILLLLFVFVGFPLFVKLAIFLGDIRTGGVSPETIEGLPPQPPTLAYLMEATKSAQIEIKGFALSGSTVKISVNGIDKKEVVTSKDGEFIVSGIKLQEGENKIKAKTINDRNKESQYSPEMIIVLDTKEPKLEITSPKDGDQFFDKDSPVTISGFTEDNVSVFINERFVSVDDKGEFNTRFELHEGENKINIIVKDKAGNQIKKELTVNYSP